MYGFIVLKMAHALAESYSIGGILRRSRSRYVGKQIIPVKNLCFSLQKIWLL